MYANWAQVKVPTAPIQRNAFELSQIVYESVSGNAYFIRGEAFFFYEINVAPSLNAWIDKKYVRVISENLQLNTPLKTITPNVIYDYQFDQLHTFPPDYQSKHGQKLNLDGFYDIEVAGRNYTPKDPTDPRWQQVINDPFYKKLPQDVLLGPLKQDHSFKFALDSQLSEDLYLFFDIESIPDFPKRWDVRIKMYEHLLAFGDIETQFSSSDYGQLTRAINGLKYEYQGENLKGILANGKQRSKPQKTTFSGNGSRKYNLPKRSLLPGTVKVWVNNKRQIEGVDQDYTLNYFSGELIFNSILTQVDIIEVIYEFTNPIDDFLPILNRKEFTGMQISWDENEEYEKTFQYATKQEIITSANLINPDLGLIHYPLQPFSESLFLGQKRLLAGRDYDLDYQSGKLSLKENKSSENLKIAYTYFRSAFQNDIFVAQNSTGPFILSQTDIIPDSLLVYVDSKQMEEIRDFLILNINDGFPQIIFNFPVPNPHLIHINYHYKKSNYLKKEIKNKGFSASASFFEEKIHNDEASLIQEHEEVLSASGNTLIVPQNPIVSPEDIEVTLDERRFLADTLTIDAYQGLIESSEFVDGQRYTIRYKTKQSESAFLSFFMEDSSLVFKIDKRQYSTFEGPIKYGGVDRILINNVEIEKGDYKVQYLENGDQFNLEFLIYNNELNKASKIVPKKNDKIDIFFQRIPNIALNGTLKKRQFVLHGGHDINKFWRIESEISGAHSNFSAQQLFEKEQIQSNGTRTFTLNHKNIIENSEKVFTFETNKGKEFAPLTPLPEEDYYINYDSGTLILNEILANNISLQIEYEYFKDSSEAVIGSFSDVLFAKQISTSFKKDILEAKLSFEAIDDQYNPIAAINRENGSKYFETDVSATFTSRNVLSGSYIRQSQIQADTQDLISDKLSTESKYGLFTNVDGSTSVFVDRQRSKHLSLQDIVDDIYKINNLKYSLNQGFRFGPQNFKNEYSYAMSHQVSDYLDKININREANFSHDFESTLSLKNVYLLGDLNFSPSLTYSESNEKQAEHEHLSQKINFDHAYSLNITPFSSWSNALNWSEKKEKASNHLKEIIKNSAILNYNYHTQLKPSPWFSSSYSLEHKETQSRLSNRLELQKDFNKISIDHFQPSGILKKTIISPRAYLYEFFSPSLMEASYSDLQLMQFDNESLQSTYDSHLSFKTLSLFNNATIEQMNFSRSQSHLLDEPKNSRLENSLYSSRLTDSTSETNFYSFLYRPNYSWLKALTLSFSIDQSQDQSNDREFIKEEESEKHSKNRQNEEKINALLSINDVSIRLFSYELFKSSLRIDHEKITDVTFSNFNFPNLIDGESSLIDELKSEKSLEIRHDLFRFISLANFGTFNHSFNFKQKNTNFRKRLESSNDTSIQQHFDQRFLESYHNDFTLKPFSLFNLLSKLNLNEEINRLLQEEQSVNFIDSTFYLFRPSYELNRYFNLFLVYSQNKLSQFTGQNFTDSLTEINLDKLSTDPNHRFEIFKQELRQLKKDISLGFTYKPYYKLTFELSSSRKNNYESRFFILNETIEEENTSFVTFQQSLITNFIPINGLDIKSKFNVDKNKQNNSNNVLNNTVGYKHELSIIYLPLKTPFMNISINFQRYDNWGYLLNDNLQEIDKETTGSIQSLEIIKQNNTEEIASLAIDYQLNFPDTPHLSNFVIKGEGFLKRFTDKILSQERNYSLTGLKINFTLNL